jgi:ribosome modulation factor
MTVNLPGHPVPRGFENWNPSHRGAYMKGYRAGVDGQPESACPYEDRRKPSGLLSWSRAYIRVWHEGWRDALTRQPQPGGEK